MENRVDDFVAGVEATFGHLARSSEELAGFLSAARQFYLDFIGLQDPSTSTSGKNELPFWRYLIFYSTLALDQAASSTLDTDELEEQKQRELAGEVSSCWPLLGMLVSRQYTSYAGSLTSQTSKAVAATESNDMHGSRESARASDTQTTTAGESRTAPFNSEDDLSDPRPTLHRHASLARAVDPVTPPVYYTRREVTTEYDNAAGQPTTASIPWDGYLDRATGRSLSESTQFSNSTSSTYPSEVLATPPMHRSAEPFFAVNDEDLYPASTAMASSPAFVGSAQMHLGADAPPHFSSYPSIGNEKPHASGTGGNPPVQRAARLVHEQQGDSGSDAITGAHAGIYNAEHPAEAKYRKSYLTRAQAAKSQELDTKVLLADRGDNTARLVPTAEGAYVLDVSIGGRKLIINPERPSEIQYHDPQGLVVTQSLFSHEIPAQ